MCLKEHMRRAMNVMIGKKKKNNRYATSLEFRLLRQYGLIVSQGINFFLHIFFYYKNKDININSLKN